ncbi:hypothetical protein CDL12_05293 [Handroanthus impetiginosus]|uniref:Uncharacterized protein n=1 Tax=Handroanthus impetiginosus TaxID=429701 RepID=A0A2G9HWY4_9LAMI|nr:hypothetical protein CDL12_05293 [Handroanthus impetiginosus]
MILIKAHGLYGNKWSEIAKLLPGRTENSVKNHWNCSLKKKLDNYLASCPASKHPRFGNKPETGTHFVEAKQSLSTKCLQIELMDGGNGGESCCLDLALGCSSNSSNHRPSTCSKIELFLDKNDTSHSTPDYLSCNDKDFTMSCSFRPRQHSDIHDNPETSLDWPYSYTGLCYEPIQNANSNIFLSTGRFPSTGSFIRQPNRSISVPPSRSHINSSCSPKAILRRAAMSYDNVPSIIRKRAIQRDVSTQDNVDDSLNEVQKVDDDDGVQNLREYVFFPPKYQKVEKFAAIKSVGKCLESAFADA